MLHPTSALEGDLGTTRIENEISAGASRPDRTGRDGAQISMICYDPPPARLMTGVSSVLSQ